MPAAPGAERRNYIDDARALELFLEMLLSERGAAAYTVAGYKRDIEHFQRAQLLHGTDLVSADGTAIRVYLSDMAQRGMAPRTAARRLSALRQFYRFLVAEDLRSDDPSAAIAGRVWAGLCRKC